MKQEAAVVVHWKKRPFGWKILGISAVLVLQWHLGSFHSNSNDNKPFSSSFFLSLQSQSDDENAKYFLA